MEQKRRCAGNGIRCVGKFLYDKGYISKTKVTIETLAGVKNLELILEYGQGKVCQGLIWANLFLSLL